jgi:hypothetical protein
MLEVRLGGGRSDKRTQIDMRLRCSSMIFTAKTPEGVKNVMLLWVRSHHCLANAGAKSDKRHNGRTIVAFI